MDSQNIPSSSKRSRTRQTSNESGSRTPNPEFDTPSVIPPFNFNNWSGFTPSQLQNMQWPGPTGNPTPFNMEHPTQHNIMNPNPFNYTHGTIFQNRPFQNPSFIPTSQQHSSGAESSTQTMPPYHTQQTEQEQPNDDDNEPLDTETTDEWMTAEEMLPFQNRTKASKAWPHYFLSVDKSKAKCRYCSTIYTARSKSGTGHLLRHIRKCKSLPDIGQRTLDSFVARPNAPEPYDYNYEECSNALSEMIIQTESSFSSAEHPSFNKYVRKNQPEHKETSRRVVRNNAMVQYLNMKQQLIAEFSNTTCKFCLTADGWDSGTDYSYICITAHWTDND